MDWYNNLRIQGKKKTHFLSDSPILFHKNPEALEDLRGILATIPSMEKTTSFFDRTAIPAAGNRLRSRDNDWETGKQFSGSFWQ